MYTVLNPLAGFTRFVLQVTTISLPASELAPRVIVNAPELWVGDVRERPAGVDPAPDVAVQAGSPE